MSATPGAPVGLHGHLRDWRYRKLSPDEQRQLRERKLRAVVREAFEHVPLYREAFRSAGLRAKDIQSLEDLDRLPVIRRADLAAAAGSDRLSQRAVQARLGSERSSGSTGQPLTVRLEPRARRSRNLRFLRALRAVGYRPGQRLLLVTDRPGAVWRRHIGWTHCSLTAEPDRLAGMLAEVRPHVLYGCTTPLRRLAECILGEGSSRGRLAHPLHAVLTTAELLDSATRRRLGAAFGCPVYDFYGLSEVGLVAAEEPDLAGYQIWEEGLLVEFLPSPTVPTLARLVVTDLEALAMPFLRYDTGDLAMLDGTGRIRRIEGRSVDCLRLSNGRCISPYAVTRALESVHGLRRYGVAQTEPDAVNVRAELGDARPGIVAMEVEAALRPVLGETVGVRFEVGKVRSGVGRGGRRVVECHVPDGVATGDARQAPRPHLDGV